MRSPDVSPFGPDLQKYWNRRHELFSRFDDGIATDAEGLYSVVPEDVALEQARRLRSGSVLDAFAGIGGSAIGFARGGKTVIAVDIDKRRLDMALHNAEIYGVADRITFILGDFFDVAPTVSAEAVNLDPPWGGPDYRARRHFGLDDFSPSGHALLDYSLSRYSEVMLRVPRNFDSAELHAPNQYREQFDDISHGRLISRTVVF